MELFILQSYYFFCGAIYSAELLFILRSYYLFCGATIFSVELLFILWSCYLFCGATIYSAELLFILWSYYLFCGATIYSAELLFILWSYYLFCGATIYSVELLFILWSYYLFCGATIYSAKAAVSLTCGGHVGVDDDPVDEEEHEDEKCPERLQQQQREINETLPCLVEQRHDEHETRPHHDDHQQQHHLADNIKTSSVKFIQLPSCWIYFFYWIYVTCSNEMSRMSVNLISRKHRINMQRWISTILTFCHQSILVSFLAMLISRLHYYLVHFIAFLDTLRNISRVNFIKRNR